MTRPCLVATAILVALASMAPASAGWSIAYAPGTNLERLDAALLGSARTSIDMARTTTRSGGALLT